MYRRELHARVAGQRDRAAAAPAGAVVLGKTNTPEGAILGTPRAPRSASRATPWNTDRARVAE